MKRYAVFLIVTFIFFSEGCAPPLKNDSGSQPENIISLLHKVNHHFQAGEGIQVDRNWKRGTYYSGLMAFYKATGDTSFLTRYITGEPNTAGGQEQNGSTPQTGSHALRLILNSIS
jgi:hypothetical protein